MIIEGFFIEEKIIFSPSDRNLKNTVNGKTIVLPNLQNLCLLYLCQNAEAVVKYDEIMAFAWGEKHINVQLTTFYQTLLQLRKLLISCGTSSSIIKTIPKKGVVITHVYQQESKSADAEPYLHTPPKDIFFRHKNIFIYVITLLSLFALMTITINFDYFYDKTNNKGNYFKYKQLENQCLIYFNRDTVDFKNHKDFVKSHIKLCSENSIMYITTYSSINSTLATVCPLNKSSSCTTYYYSDDSVHAVIGR